MNDFVQSELDLNKVIDEITTGKGYMMLPQLFTPEDIEHARQTTLYLIKTQGKKATHFQVSQNIFTLLCEVFF